MSLDERAQQFYAPTLRRFEVGAHALGLR